MKAAILIAVLTGASTLVAQELTETKDKFAYGVGMMMGNNLKRAGIGLDQLNTNLLLQGIRDTLQSNKLLLTESNAMVAIRQFQTDTRNALGERNRKASEEFLANNKTKPGIQVLPVPVDGKTVELQYKVLAEGEGQSPTTNDMVTVNYRGTLIDGTEFDSSAKAGKPATFRVVGVIKGWTEILQRMKPGAKYEVYLPSELAYRDRGQGMLIGPNAALVFEIELIKAEPIPVPTLPPTTQQPVTSDIIKVPSKEELEKGAKIEVIKASELEKYKEKEKQEAEKKKE